MLERDRYTARQPHSWILAPVARRHARTLLKKARKLAPFVVEYALANAELVYARVSGGNRAIAWKRPLAGWYRSADHVTQLFKKEMSRTPYCLILHTPSAGPVEHLAAIGIRASPPCMDA